MIYTIYNYNYRHLNKTNKTDKTEKSNDISE